MAVKKGRKSSPKPAPKKAGKNKEPAKEPTLKELQRQLDTLKKQNEKQGKKLDEVTKKSRDQQKQIAGLNRGIDAMGKREEILLAALEIKPKSKKGDTGAIGRLNQSLLTTDEHILSMGKRIENMLTALKNHREYLIRLNKKVYKVDPIKKIEMELAIINNTLLIMGLSGFDINRALFGDMKGIQKMMAKEDADLAKVQKRMAGFRKKYEDEMQRFDVESIFKKSVHIPGYR
jgi:hypothetical protein